MWVKTCDYLINLNNVKYIQKNVSIVEDDDIEFYLDFYVSDVVPIKILYPSAEKRDAAFESIIKMLSHGKKDI